MKCPKCETECADNAPMCLKCGRPFRVSHPTAVAEKPDRVWNANTAAVLSLIMPGAGQLYKGKPFDAMVWFVLVVAVYLLFFVPGLAIHAACIADAKFSNRTQ